MELTDDVIEALRMTQLAAEAWRKAGKGYQAIVLETMVDVIEKEWSKDPEPTPSALAYPVKWHTPTW